MQLEAQMLKNLSMQDKRWQMNMHLFKQDVSLSDSDQVKQHSKRCLLFVTRLSKPVHSARNFVKTHNIVVIEVNTW